MTKILLMHVSFVEQQRVNGVNALLDIMWPYIWLHIVHKPLCDLLMHNFSHLLPNEDILEYFTQTWPPRSDAHTVNAQI